MIYLGDNDPASVRWLHHLMNTRQIPEGFIDDRSIVEVGAGELAGCTQVHLFAGIGGWPLALELAGCGPDRPVWTASCPCPPFSAAGKQKACPHCAGGRVIWCPRRTGYAICINCRHAWLADERHLWPEVWRLIEDCRPGCVIGEQVDSSVAEDWLAAVCLSLEILGYDFRAVGLPASFAGAPHIRHRFFWMAYRDGEQWRLPAGRRRDGKEDGRQEGPDQPQARGEDGRLGDMPGDERHRVGLSARPGRQDEAAPDAGRRGEDGRLGDVLGAGLEGHAGDGDGSREPGRLEADENGPVAAPGFWDNCGLVLCSDGKARPAEPGVHPLAHGIPGRVDAIRGYGNAIVPQVAAEFIREVMEEIE